MAEELADLQNQQNEKVISQTPSGPESPVIGQDTAKKTSLRDELKKNFKELSKPEALAKPEKTPDKAPVRPTAEERPRDETGKFVKAEEKKESPQPKEEAKEASAPPGPPPGWSAESKAFFASLPPDHPIRKDVAKREEEVSSGFKSKTEELKRYQELESVLSPLRPIYQRAGVQSDAEAIKRLAMWEAYIRQNPPAALAEMARQYGVTSAPNPQTPQEEIPQVVRPILDQFGRLNQEFNAFKTDLQRQQEERIAERLSAFAKDKPYFERVKVTMGKLMDAGFVPATEESLDIAYQKAIALHPDIQAEIKSDEEAKRLIESQKHNQERVQKAAQAAVSPSTRAPSAAITSSKKQPGIRGSILQAIEEVRGNGRA